MTRLEAGALEVKRELVSVEELVGSALGRTADRMRAIETDVPPELRVSCDAALMEQVLVNLLENVAKYTPPASPARIDARLLPASDGGGIAIDVSDRGPGVSSDDARRVFDKFYRAREGEGGGVGLGLTICRGIVEDHGGTIAALERVGGGATFRVVLPGAAASS